MNAPATIAMLTALIAVAGCGRSTEGEAGAPSAAVLTAPVELRDIQQSVTGYGTIEFAPALAESLVVQVESQVAAVLVAAGTHVRRGEGLLRLRPSAATRLEVDRAIREAALAANEARRMARLREEGLATEADAEAAKTLAATASQLRDSLSERTGGGREFVLAAPRDGIVDAMTAQPGDLLAAGATAARIGDPGGLQARIGLEPNAAISVRRGAPATVTLLGAGTHSVAGRVSAIEERVDKDSRLAAALVAVPGGKGLMPGAPVAGGVVVASRAHAVAVPRAALLYEGNEASLFVVVGAKAHKRLVRTGVADDEFVEITEGVKPGESVVTTGNHELEDGMAVRSAAPPAATAEPAQDAS
jgi:membrane fusion protein, multidrug efflux system